MFEHSGLSGFPVSQHFLLGSAVAQHQLINLVLEFDGCPLQRLRDALVSTHIVIQLLVLIRQHFVLVVHGYQLCVCVRVFCVMSGVTPLFLCVRAIPSVVCVCTCVLCYVWCDTTVSM